jgi:GH25 family lysozyme M1 (1,4-beta-N-acetylmuramidase)
MKGIDISGWQKGIKLDKIDHDFVIIKATQGAKMTSNSFADQACQAFALGKKVGFYHYAGGGGAEAEAKHFIEVVKPYLGKAILVLDWEGQENPNFGNCAYAIDLLAQIKKLSGGITPFIYMSKSYVRQWAAAWATIAREVPLWCAQYANNQITGYQENPWTDAKGFGPWGDGCAIYQYSSHGRINGWASNLDLDKAFITPEQWDAYASGSGAPAAAPKSVDELAQEVIEGKWGNGVDRKARLAAAGHDYNAIQKKVNQMMKK